MAKSFAIRDLLDDDNNCRRRSASTTKHRKLNNATSSTDSTTTIAILEPHHRLELARKHSTVCNAQIRLEGVELWRKFNRLGTEMIVTKSGRRMFPTLQISVVGLSADRNYSLMVDFASIDEKRYRYSFHQSRWTITGPGDAELPCRVHVHSESPASGAHWMRQTISFDKLKLTNNQLDSNGYIIVNSMHRYQPRIHILMHDDGDNIIDNHQQQQTYIFPETAFMAVTAYQNHRIASNPFAKGFRDSELDEKCWIYHPSALIVPTFGLFPPPPPPSSTTTTTTTTTTNTI